MGAHHAPVHLTRRATTARVAGLAGRGVLTASAVLALAGAGGGIALAHDDEDGDSRSSDRDGSLLCGVFGGDECSSDGADDDSSRGDDGPGDTGSFFDRFDGIDGFGPSYDGDSERSSSSEDDRPDRASGGESASGSRPASGQQSSTAKAKPASSTPAPTRATGLDAPPPPGQVRTIQVPR